MSQISSHSGEGPPPAEGRGREGPTTPARGKRAPLRQAWRTVLISVAIAPLLLAATCQRKEVITSLPEEMHGRWRTKAQSHADAYLDLSRDQIGFGSEGNAMQVFRIYRIEADRSRSEDVPLYTIEYITADGNRFFSFWYQERFRVIRLNHRWDMMWRLESEESELPSATAGEEEEAAVFQSPRASLPPPEPARTGRA